MTYIPLDLDTGRRDHFGAPVCRRGFLTSDSVVSSYGLPVLDTGDDTDYGPSDMVPSYGRTAADLVADAATRLNVWPLEEGTPDAQKAAYADILRDVRKFLRQWPEGPQL